MTRLTHILVGTDFSANAADALGRAAALASASGARLTLVHALESPDFAAWHTLLGDGEQALRTGLRSEADERLRDAASSLGSGLHLDIHVSDESPAVAFPRLASERGVDMVVLGQHGADEAPSLLLGSTASRVLRKSRVPVLIVRRRPVAPYAAPLVAVDFSPAAGLSIDLLRAVAPGARATLAYVHEFPYEGKLQFAGIDDSVIARFREESAEQARAALGQLAASHRLPPGSFEAALLRGRPARAILQAANARGSDIIVVGKHGRHLIDELLLGSVTSHLIAESSADVLVVVDSRRPALGTAP